MHESEWLENTIFAHMDGFPLSGYPQACGPGHSIIVYNFCVPVATAPFFS